MDERERLLSKLNRFLTIRDRISDGLAVAVIEELIRETEERLTQIENKVPDQKAMQPPSERCRNDDLPHNSPRPRDPCRHRLL
jgi:hypothetical protein